MMDALPIPTSCPIPMTTMNKGNASLMPAIPSVPTPWPTKMASTTLYKACTSSATIAGAVIRNINRPIGS